MNARSDAASFVAYSACPRQYGKVKPSGVNAKALAALAKVVVDTRKRVGMTQEEVAFDAGVSVRHLQSLESGQLNPSYLVLLAVSRALKVPVSRLLSAAEGFR
jgi:DNA-binding XRE family transcriptional regulator